MSPRFRKNSVLVTACVVFVFLFCVVVSPRSYCNVTATRKKSVQRCVHDPVPCPRLSYPDRTNDSLIDFKDFKLVLNTKPCTDEATVLVLVHSAANHFKERDSIRSSWSAGSGWLKNLSLRVVFFLADVEDASLQALIEHENHFYGDTVQGNFVDSYHNLTYKHIMALRWATTYCPTVPRVIKMDDDIFVHVFNLAKALELTEGMGTGWIACYVQRQMPVVRSPGSKWRVEESDYPGSFFEDYCSGWAYLTEPATIASIIEESRYRPYFWVDDVHVTGTLARMAGVRLHRTNSFYTTEAQTLAAWADNGEGKRLDWKYTFGPTWGEVELVQNAHRKAKWCRKVRCQCCFKVEASKPGGGEEGNASTARLAGKAVVVPLAV
ncbi:beta-1,3-galactosyltransferase 5-like [Ornithodoros turicata]